MTEHTYKRWIKCRVHCIFILRYPEHTVIMQWNIFILLHPSHTLPWLHPPPLRCPPAVLPGPRSCDRLACAVCCWASWRWRCLLCRGWGDAQGWWATSLTCFQSFLSVWVRVSCSAMSSQTLEAAATLPTPTSPPNCPLGNSLQETVGIFLVLIIIRTISKISTVEVLSHKTKAF